MDMESRVHPYLLKAQFQREALHRSTEPEGFGSEGGTEQQVEQTQTASMEAAAVEDRDKVETAFVSGAEWEAGYDPDADVDYDGHFTYYRKKSPMELRWEVNRERSPDSLLNWFFYVCLLGAEPGPKPDPNTPNPYKKTRPKRKGREDLEEQMKEFKRPEKKQYKEDRVEVDPAKKPYKQQVFEALADEDNKLAGDRVVQLAYHLGIAPDKEKSTSAETGESMDIRRFYKYLYECEDPLDTVDSLQVAFKTFDKQGSGLVPEYCLRSFLLMGDSQLDDNEANKIVAMYSKKGQVDYIAFLEDIMSMRPKPGHLSHIGTLKEEPTKEYQPAITVTA